MRNKAEFISKNVNNRILVGKLLAIREIISDTFKIIDKRKDNIIILKALSNQKEYKVKVVPEQIEKYTPRRLVMAKIFPWEDYYRFAGITKIKVYDNNRSFPNGIITPDMVEQIQDYFEKRFVKDAESIIISRRATLSGMLNKFPYWWIDGISASLLLNKKGKKKEKVMRIVKVLVNSQRLNYLVNTFPKDSQKVLFLIKERGGVVKYREIIKKYSDDTNLAWEKEPPNSPIGLLRRHGLVIVGKMLIDNRFYKVVLIPKEILEKLSL